MLCWILINEALASLRHLIDFPKKGKEDKVNNEENKGKTTETNKSWCEKVDGISDAARKKILYKISGRVLHKCYNGVARKEGRSSGGNTTGERSNRPAAKSRRYGKYRREIRAINTQRPNFVPLPLAAVAGVVHRSLFYEKKKGNHGKANILGNILAVCSIES